MATIKPVPGKREHWQVVVDKKGVRKKKTIVGLAKARAWAADFEANVERRISEGLVAPKGTLGELITRYEKEMWPHLRWGDSKAENLRKLKQDLGAKELAYITKQMAQDYGMKISATRGPNGVRERLSYLSEVLQAGHDQWDIDISGQPVRTAMAALRRIRVLGIGKPRIRQLTEADIAAMMAAAERTSRARINLPAVIDFLRLVPLRVGELCSIQWERMNDINKSVDILRKHPTDRSNWCTVHLPIIGGIDTYEMLKARPRYSEGPFPYDSKAVSTLFWRTHRLAGIADFHLHDLRAHAISFMLAFAQPQTVAAISGHTNWVTMARHYARMTPDQVRMALERSGVSNADARSHLKLVTAA